MDIGAIRKAFTELFALLKEHLVKILELLDCWDVHKGYEKDDEAELA